MDVIFGSVQAEKRKADIAAQERGTLLVTMLGAVQVILRVGLAVLENDARSPVSEESSERKV